MTIKDIAVKNLLRRKGKAAFILAGLVIGVAVVVAVVGFADSMTRDINHKLEKYGANILIVPRTDNLALTYGGMTLGGVSFEMEPILESQLGRINTIKNAANIAAAGPITLGTVNVNMQAVLLAGVDFDAMGTLKPWWKIKGRKPAGDEVLIGSEAANLLGLKPQQEVTLNGSSKAYGQGASTVAALNRISFSIRSGEFVGIMGESGAGKSTLLAVMGAMNTPSGGRYVVDDLDIYALSGEQRADFRREYLGFVFQSFHLVPYLTVAENVMLPLAAVKKPGREKEAMAMEALDWVGLEAKACRLPNQISGGECERAAVARAIVNNPPVLLADEPTGNLDSRNTREIMDLLARLHAGGTTIVMVTHSAGCAAYAQRILHVADGRLDQAHSKGAPHRQEYPGGVKR